MANLFRIAAASIALSVLAIVASVPASAQRAAPIDLTFYKGSFVIGIEGGHGVVHFRGRPYPIRLIGGSVGLTVGLAKAELHGEVLNLHNIEDIEGFYNAFQAGAAAIRGGKVIRIKNSKGVVIAVSGDQVGLEFSLDLNGISVSLDERY